MTEADDASDTLSGWVAAVLSALRDKAEPMSPAIRVCRACVALLPVDGAAVSLILDSRHRHSLYASDTVAERLEHLQFTLGEGPCFEAFDTGEPVLVPDLAHDSAQAWPVFATQVDAAEVGAIFAFPLRRGAARVGALDLYRQSPGWLSEAELATALTIADIATSALLAVSAADGDGVINEDWLTALTRNRAVVHQATGIVIAEFGISADQALARLRAYAFTTGRLLDDVARDMVAGRLHPGVIGR